MRRFVSLAILIFFAIPFGASISGCSKNSAPTYCNGQTSGVQVGQLTTLDLEPRLTGISLNQGEIGRVSSPSGKDCRGSSASSSNIVYGSTDLSLVDVEPRGGTLCAGSWNRQTGGGIPDYTVCTPSSRTGIALVTASSEGVVSNPIPVFVHPIVTSILLGPASTNCTTDPASNCVDLTQPTGCVTGPINASPVYDGNSCISQGSTKQLVARTYQGNGTSAAANISCQVGPLQFSALNPSVVTIDANGVATAAQPGSSTINASITLASSTAGFFSTCPPTSIVLTAPPQTGTVSVNQNTAQPLVATVTDKNNVTMTNVQLEYVSTNPVIIPTGGSSITPTYPGSAAVYALCQPPNCNVAPLNEIGLFNNGTPVTSNPVQIAANGTNFSTVLYIASTQSQFILPVDFTVPTQLTPVRLPYAPKSLVMSEDGSSIYMGTDTEIMIYSTASNALVRQDPAISGKVIAVSPDNSTVVITDPVRKLTYLYLAAGSVSAEYGGIATRAAWSADSQTVYIATADGRLLVHSNFTGWNAINLPSVASDVAVTVPAAGVYLGGTPVDVRTNCPATTINNPSQGFLQTTVNTFYPDAGVIAANAARLFATNDGLHMLGASTTAFTDIKTNLKTGACPVTFTSTPALPIPFTGITFPATVPGTAPYPDSPIQSVLTTSDSKFAFVTYAGTGGVIPQYDVVNGLLTNLSLQKTAAGTPLDAISGVISGDDKTLYVGSEGDNLVHILVRGAAGFTDTVPVNPALPNLNGSPTSPPNFIVQRPRRRTS